jgi:hypothetical protein
VFTALGGVSQPENYMRLASLVVGLALAILFVAASPAFAQSPPRVINIIGIETGGDTAKFLEFVKRARAINEQYGSTGTTRVFQATLAGPNTGNMAVAVEFPSMTSMAESQAKIGPSPEWQKFVADFQAAGMSVISNSVSVEITP